MKQTANKYTSRAGHYYLSFDPADIDQAVVLKELNQTSWADDMSRETLDLAIRHATTVAALTNNTNKTIGFARVVSDLATFAYLTDVVVPSAYRGQGIARQMSCALLEHPKLAHLKHWALLASHDRVALLYADLGFEKQSHQHAWMERFV